MPKPFTPAPRCASCGEIIRPPARHRAGYCLCLDCGEKQARQVRHITAPINKSAYMLITDPELLKQLNPKRTS